MRLVDNWRRVLKHAWSIRLALLAAVLSGAEVMCSVVADSPPIPKGTFALLSGMVTVAAAVARLVSQESVSGTPAGGDQ